MGFFNIPRPPTPGEVISTIGNALSHVENKVEEFVGDAVNDAVSSVQAVTMQIANAPQATQGGAATGASVTMVRSLADAVWKAISGLRGEIGTINARLSKLAEYSANEGGGGFGGGGGGNDELLTILLLGGSTSLTSDPLTLMLLLGGGGFGGGGGGGAFGGMSTLEVMMLLGKI